MTVLSATEILFLDGPRVGSPAILAYFVVMNRPVAPVSKMSVLEPVPAAQNLINTNPFASNPIPP